MNLSTNISVFRRTLVQISSKNLSRNLLNRSGTRLLSLYSTNSEEPVIIQNKTEFEMSPSLFAFLNRMNLKIEDKKFLEQIFTDRTYMPDHCLNNNDTLSFIGRKVIDFFVLEYFHLKYPNAPKSILNSLLDLHFGIKAMANIGTQFNIFEQLRCELSKSVEEQEMLRSKQQIIARGMRALVGGLYHQYGAKVARNYVHNYLIKPRPNIDLKILFKFEQPKRHLSAILNAKGKEFPQSRILKESGRISNSPLYIVGVFSGSEKLGEDYGNSLKMAEFRACRDALFKHYLVELKDFQLPSDTIVEDDITFLPSKLGETPVGVKYEKYLS